MSLFTPHMRGLWKEWELRLLVLLSLLLQLLLLVYGRRRKTTSNAAVRTMVWCTYIMAEAVAAYGLSQLSNRVAQIQAHSSDQSFVVGIQLSAFWAPFLLIHLGGPDAITAYSLEDNELWLRYLGKFVSSITVTVYIYCLALTGSKFSIMSCVVIAIGFIKYGERILCLYKASRGRLRDSLMLPPDLGYPVLIERYQRKQQQGYEVSTDMADRELRVPEALIDDSHKKSDDEDQDIIVATEMFSITKCLFVDLIRSSNDLESSKDLFMTLSSERAFRIVEIELLFMYELLYNKVTLLATYWGAASRISTVSLFMGMLVFFKLENKTMIKDRVDVAVTYLLLVSSAAIDLFSTLRLVSTDWAKSKRIRNPKRTTNKILQKLDIRLFRESRWSCQVSQLSLVEFSLNPPYLYTWVHPPKPIKQLVEKAWAYFAVKYEPFSNYMKDWIYEHVKRKLLKFSELRKTDEQGAMSMLVQYQAATILEKASRHTLMWSTQNMDFDLSILIWHIATEICYHHDWDVMVQRDGQPRNNYRMSLFISRYMLYLLVMNSDMLPVGIGQLRYSDALVDGRKYFKEISTVLEKNKKSRTPCSSSKKNGDTEKEGSSSLKDQQHCKDMKCNQDLRDGCELLLKRVEDVPNSIFNEGESKSEMLSACALATQLNKLWDKKVPEAMDMKWKLIADIWAEALMHAAVRSSGTEHAKRLSVGGELLSHVWILMAHFGMSNNIRNAQGNIINKIVSK